MMHIAVATTLPRMQFHSLSELLMTFQRSVLPVTKEHAIEAQHDLDQSDRKRSHVLVSTNPNLPGERC
jgi:hypothetical protein